MLLPYFQLIVLFLVTQTASAPVPSTADAAKHAIDSAIGAILQADGSTAKRFLASAPNGGLSERDEAFRTCALNRLKGPDLVSPIVSPKTSATDATVERVLAIYRSYWREGVSRPANRSKAEQRLVAGLASLLSLSPSSKIDVIEPVLKAKLGQVGFYSLQGKTGLLNDLMIWGKQTERLEEVSLPEEKTHTRVFYLDEFASRGWSSYLTCDRTGTGGWTTPEGLFVVVPSYESLSDENFRVNFLAHESQHFVDNTQFPGLPGWRLEYRAKLVELAYANTTKNKVLGRFATSQGDDPADAHSYANKRVLMALCKRLLTTTNQLSSIATEDLQNAAIDELRSDTQKLTEERGKSGQ